MKVPSFVLLVVPKSPAFRLIDLKIAACAFGRITCSKIQIRPGGAMGVLPMDLSRPCRASAPSRFLRATRQKSRRRLSRLFADPGLRSLSVAPPWAIMCHPYRGLADVWPLGHRPYRVAAPRPTVLCAFAPWRLRRFHRATPRRAMRLDVKKTIAPRLDAILIICCEHRRPLMDKSFTGYLPQGGDNETVDFSPNGPTGRITLTDFANQSYPIFQPCQCYRAVDRAFFDRARMIRSIYSQATAHV